MKNKLVILIAAIFSMASIHCFAVEIHKGKLISHKEWATGKAKGGFISKPDAKKVIKMSNGRQDAFIEAWPAKGVAGSMTSVMGNHRFGVGNDSDETQTYWYYLSTCAMTSDHTGNCVHVFDSISLEPGGYFFYNAVGEVQIAFDKPGSYQTFSTAFIYPHNDDMTTKVTSSSTAEIS